MARNEVDVRTSEKGATGLLLASKIRLSNSGGTYEASGGELEIIIGWDISAWELEPTAFRVSRK